MVVGFSKLVIKVPVLNQAVIEYQSVLGGFRRQEGSAYLPLFNVGVELLEDNSLDVARIDGLELLVDAGKSIVGKPRGLAITASNSREVSSEATATGVRGIDHIVLRTADADDCVRRFRDDLGMRLALDQAVPEWGGRMLFFRCGKLTLEVIQGDELPVADFFWGVTYLCDDLDATLAKLDQSGVTHSGARLGRKPGTRVATVKSHCLGLPTLLIEAAAGPGNSAQDPG